MLKDGSVDLVEVLLRCCDSAATALTNCNQSLCCKSFPFTDKSTGSCSPNEQSTCNLDQISNDLFTRPGSIQRMFLSNERQVIAASMSCRIKSRCSAPGIWQKPQRIGTSGLLVISTRSRTFSNRASAKSRRIIWIWSSLLHSSRASTISTYEDRDELLSSLDSGRKTSWRHWSWRD